MSNKLKTLSRTQLEHLIGDSISQYLKEDCSCTISEINTPNIDSEADIALHDERNITFKVHLSYTEAD